MEFKWFNKKELSIIADVMVNELGSIPDGTYTGMLNVFQRAMQAEYIEDLYLYGFKTHGYRISDVLLPNGQHFSEQTNWDFNNHAWHADDEQGNALYDLFVKKAQRKGYIIDASCVSGLYVGLPCYTTRCLRNKQNLIASFAEIKELQKGNDRVEKYYVRKRFENGWHNIKTELQLWRIPKGCTTGKVPIFGRVSCFVLKGMCLYESSRWDYAAYYPKKKASWHEQKTKAYLKINKSAFVKGNRGSLESKDPAVAWLKLTNTGKSDLHVFVVDADNKL